MVIIPKQRECLLKERITMNLEQNIFAQYNTNEPITTDRSRVIHEKEFYYKNNWCLPYTNTFTTNIGQRGMTAFSFQ